MIQLFTFKNSKIEIIWKAQTGYGVILNKENPHNKLIINSANNNIFQKHLIINSEKALSVEQKQK